MKRIITLLLCFSLILTFFTSCNGKYEFSYAFFPINVENDYEAADSIEGDDITNEFEPLLNQLLPSLIRFINYRFNLALDKPIPAVKSFNPAKESIVATYFNGTLFVNLNAISEYTNFFIVHELIHYISDNDGDTGFTHITNYSGYKVLVGYGLTEGYTDILAYMYCEENGIDIPDLANLNYNNNERIAAVYYLLEPETMRWFLTSNYESMGDFAKENIENVAIIPNDYIDDFHFHFYVCQDLLLDCSTGNINDYNSFRLSFKSSFELACITARASKNTNLKKQIYNDILSICDSNNTLKNMILD